MSLVLPERMAKSKKYDILDFSFLSLSEEILNSVILNFINSFLCDIRMRVAIFSVVLVVSPPVSLLGTHGKLGRCKPSYSRCDKWYMNSDCGSCCNEFTCKYVQMYFLFFLKKYISKIILQVSQRAERCHKY